jgi:CRISPR-associated protein Cas1
MKKLLNVLFVTSPDSFVSLENENVVVKGENRDPLRLPLLNLEAIFCFNYFGATPALMAECAKRNITLSFLTEYGKFLGTLYGESKGNVLLRKEQYRISDRHERSLDFAKSFIFAKIYHQKWVLERALRDHSLRVDEPQLTAASTQISENLKQVLPCENVALLRAIEGNAAQAYFRVFNELILQNQTDFAFTTRQRRPPPDPINALLSFTYALLTGDCRHAVEAVGLDAFVGFMHADRAGRPALALDLMEELRPIFADRFVLSLINRKEIVPPDFETQASGAVLINPAARKKILAAWQQRKKEEITHPFLGEKIAWGLVPYVQALLLARVIRQDLEKYPPFLWK